MQKFRQIESSVQNLRTAFLLSVAGAQKSRYNGSSAKGSAEGLRAATAQLRIQRAFARRQSHRFDEAENVCFFIQNERCHVLKTRAIQIQFNRVCAARPAAEASASNDFMRTIHDFGKGMIYRNAKIRKGRSPAQSTDFGARHPAPDPVRPWDDLYVHQLRYTRLSSRQPDFGKGAFSLVVVEGMQPKDVSALKARFEGVAHVER